MLSEEHLKAIVKKDLKPLGYLPYSFLCSPSIESLFAKKSSMVFCFQPQKKIKWSLNLNPDAIELKKNPVAVRVIPKIQTLTNETDKPQGISFEEFYSQPRPKNPNCSQSDALLKVSLIYTLSLFYTMQKMDNENSENAKNKLEDSPSSLTNSVNSNSSSEKSDKSPEMPHIDIENNYKNSEDNNNNPSSETQEPTKDVFNDILFFPKNANFPYLFEVFESENCFYISTSFSILSLKKFLAQSKAIFRKQERKRLFLFYQMVQAMLFLHKNGMTHGYLRPENMYVTSQLWLKTPLPNTLYFPTDFSTEKMEDFYIRKKLTNNELFIHFQKEHSWDETTQQPNQEEKKPKNHLLLICESKEFQGKRTLQFSTAGDRNSTSPSQSSRNVFSSKKSVVGRRPNEKDLESAMFMSNSAFSEGEIVIVFSNYHSGYVYGKVLKLPKKYHNNPSHNYSKKQEKEAEITINLNNRPNVPPANQNQFPLKQTQKNRGYPSGSQSSNSYKILISEEPNQSFPEWKEYTPGGIGKLLIQPSQSSSSQDSAYKSATRNNYSYSQNKTSSIQENGYQSKVLNSKKNDITTLVEKWQHWDLSNYDYLLALNLLVGRKKGMFSFSAVFPWVIDFKSETSYRDLRKSKIRLAKGEETLDMTYQCHINNDDDGSSNFSSEDQKHHITEPISEITFFSYHARRTPISLLKQYVRPNYEAREYPSSIERLYSWTPDECIPEFYSEADIEIFKSIHTDMTDLEVPKWAHGNTREFVQKHRTILESDTICENLPCWIDLVFGYKLGGVAAVEEKNVPQRMSENDVVPRQLGFIQLFNTPHPKKLKKIGFDATESKFIFEQAENSPISNLQIQTSTQNMRSSLTASLAVGNLYVSPSISPGLVGDSPRGGDPFAPDANSPSFGQETSTGGSKSPPQQFNIEYSILEVQNMLNNMETFENGQKFSNEYFVQGFYHILSSFGPPTNQIISEDAFAQTMAGWNWENLAADDYFGLGCLLYELFALKPLFSSKKQIKMYFRQKWKPNLSPIPSPCDLMIKDLCDIHPYQRLKALQSSTAKNLFPQNFKYVYYFLSRFYLLLEKQQRYLFVMQHEKSISELAVEDFELLFSHVWNQFQKAKSNWIFLVKIFYSKWFYEKVRQSAILKSMISSRILDLYAESSNEKLQGHLLSIRVTKTVYHLFGNQRVFIEKILPFFLEALNSKFANVIKTANLTIVRLSHDTLGVLMTIQHIIEPLLSEIQRKYLKVLQQNTAFEKYFDYLQKPENEQNEEEKSDFTLKILKELQDLHAHQNSTRNSLQLLLNLAYIHGPFNMLSYYVPRMLKTIIKGINTTKKKNKEVETLVKKGQKDPKATSPFGFEIVDDINSNSKQNGNVEIELPHIQKVGFILVDVFTMFERILSKCNNGDDKSKTISCILMNNLDDIQTIFENFECISLEMFEIITSFFRFLLFLSDEVSTMNAVKKMYQTLSIVFKSEVNIQKFVEIKQKQMELLSVPTAGGTDAFSSNGKINPRLRPKSIQDYLVNKFKNVYSGNKTSPMRPNSSNQEEEESFYQENNIGNGIITFGNPNQTQNASNVGINVTSTKKQINTSSDFEMDDNSSNLNASSSSPIQEILISNSKKDKKRSENSPISPIIQTDAPTSSSSLSSESEMEQLQIQQNNIQNSNNNIKALYSTVFDFRKACSLYKELCCSLGNSVVHEMISNSRVFEDFIQQQFFRPVFSPHGSSQPQKHSKKSPSHFKEKKIPKKNPVDDENTNTDDNNPNTDDNSTNEDAENTENDENEDNDVSNEENETIMTNEDDSGNENESISSAIISGAGNKIPIPSTPPPPLISASPFMTFLSTSPILFSNLGLFNNQTNSNSQEESQNQQNSLLGLLNNGFGGQNDKKSSYFTFHFEDDMEFASTINNSNLNLNLALNTSNTDNNSSLAKKAIQIKEEINQIMTQFAQQKSPSQLLNVGIKNINTNAHHQWFLKTNSIIQQLPQTSFKKSMLFATDNLPPSGSSGKPSNSSSLVPKRQTPRAPLSGFKGSVKTTFETQHHIKTADILSLNERLLLLGGKDGVFIWNMEKNKVSKSNNPNSSGNLFPAPEKSKSSTSNKHEAVYAKFLDKQGISAVYLDSSGVIRILDTATAKMTQKVFSQKPYTTFETLNDPFADPNPHLIATTYSYDMMIRLIDLRIGGECQAWKVYSPGQPIIGASNLASGITPTNSGVSGNTNNPSGSYGSSKCSIKSIAYHPYNNSFLVSCSNGLVSAFERYSGIMIDTFRLTNPNSSPNFETLCVVSSTLRHDPRFITCGPNKTVKIWNSKFYPSKLDATFVVDPNHNNSSSNPNVFDSKTISGDYFYPSNSGNSSNSNNLGLSSNTGSNTNNTNFFNLPFGASSSSAQSNSSFTKVSFDPYSGLLVGVYQNSLSYSLIPDLSEEDVRWQMANQTSNDNVVSKMETKKFKIGSNFSDIAILPLQQFVLATTEEGRIVLMN